MGVSRRALLITGSAAIVVTGAGWALTRSPRAAREPWKQAGKGFGDPRLDIIAYAILAPNPHNMQPWRVRLEDENAFALYCDLTRLLPETDPPNRQITIGFGCFLELVRQAGAEKGFRAEIDPFPEGEPYPQLDERPVARVRLTADPSVAREPLFGHVLGRRTNRAPFDLSRAVPQSELDAIAGAAASNVVAETVSDKQTVDALRALTEEAWRIEWSTPHTRRESIIVTRIGKSEINNNPYGLALTGAVPEALAGAGLLSREKMDTPGTPAYDEALKFYERACASANAYAVIKTNTNTRADQLEAGQAWVRMQLMASALGVSFHPLSQALQEFPEMRESYARAHEILGAANGETVQMLSRLGYAGDPAPAPREALESKLMPVA